MKITDATDPDFNDIWTIFKAVVAPGTTYVYSPNTTKAQAFDIWMTRPKKTCIVRSDTGEALGTYYIKENRPDLGSHICRCGFMVAPTARRQGVGEAMCRHALTTANQLGFRGMQLSYVVATNQASIRLWLKMGFTHIGTVPKAFQHAQKGDVVVLIMYKSLTE